MTDSAFFPLKSLIYVRNNAIIATCFEHDNQINLI